MTNRLRLQSCWWLWLSVSSIYSQNLWKTLMGRVESLLKSNPRSYLYPGRKMQQLQGISKMPDLQWKNARPGVLLEIPKTWQNAQPGRFSIEKHPGIVHTPGLRVESPGLVLWNARLASVKRPNKGFWCCFRPFPPVMTTKTRQTYQNTKIEDHRWKAQVMCYKALKYALPNIQNTC